MKRTLLLPLLIMLVFITAPAYGQGELTPETHTATYQQDVRFEHLTTKDGQSLGHDFVQSVVEDRNGMIWVGLWWFWGLLLALVALALYGAYRWRVRSYQARNRELEAEVAEKTRDLQEEIREHETTQLRLRRTRDELSTTLSISRELVSTLELESLLDLILEGAQKVITFDSAAGIMTLNNDRLEFQVYHGLPVNEDMDSLAFPVEAVTPIKNLVLDRQAFIIDDLKQEPGLAQEFLKNVGSSLEDSFGRGRSWMCVPLIAREEVIGLLGLVHQKPGYYHANTLELAQVFANQAAIAIENTRLYQQAQAAAVAEERNRLARELHDSVTQSIYSASLMAEVLPEILKRDPDKTKDGLEELRQLTRGALAEMRTMLLELRPEALIKTPLDDLLEQLVEALTSRMEIKAETDIQPVPDLPSKVHINIYRVAQEALNNIIKHTEASQLSLRLVASPPYSSAAAEAWQGQIELCIRDNGSGFDPGETTPESLGMGIMRERVREIGGKLSIESQPREGTEVVLVWEDS